MHPFPACYDPVPDASVRCGGRQDCPGALMANGPQAREVAQLGWWGAIGFVVLILAVSGRKWPKAR